MSGWIAWQRVPSHFFATHSNNNCNIIICCGYVGAAISHHLFLPNFLDVTTLLSNGWKSFFLRTSPEFESVSLDKWLWCKNCNFNRNWIGDVLYATWQALLSWLCGSHYCPSSPSSARPKFLKVTSLYYWMAGCHSFFLPSCLPISINLSLPSQETLKQKMYIQRRLHRR